MSEGVKGGNKNCTYPSVTTSFLFSFAGERLRSFFVWTLFSIEYIHGSRRISAARTSSDLYVYPAGMPTDTRDREKCQWGSFLPSFRVDKDILVLRTVIWFSLPLDARGVDSSVVSQYLLLHTLPWPEAMFIIWTAWLHYCMKIHNIQFLQETTISSPIKYFRRSFNALLYPLKFNELIFVAILSVQDYIIGLPWIANVVLSVTETLSLFFSMQCIFFLIKKQSLKDL